VKKQFNHPHKLALRKETVRNLNRLELAAAAGGFALTQPPSCAATCPSVHKVCPTTITTTTL
jgi:hypothetical protein